jgi:hypothetical protein
MICSRLLLVEGLVFKSFKVFGEYIPSVKSIEDVMRDRPNEAAKVEFQTLSNHICEIYEQECKNEYPPDLPENKQARENIDLLREHWGHTEEICRLIKYDFYQLMINRYILHWYHFVAGNWSGGNPQAVIRGNKPPKNYMEPILRLRKYPDFARAEGFMYGYDESVNSAISGGDCEVSKLQDDVEKIVKALAKIDETSRQDGNKAVNFYCEYCHSYHTFDDLKVRKTCGSPECEKKHDNSRKLIDRKGWVEDSDIRPKKCVMGGSRQAKLNSFQLCLRCHLELVACIETNMV